MSTHQAELVKVQMTKLEGSDNLSVIPVFGYTYIGLTKNWEGVKYGVWFPPDTLVDTHLPEFHELAKDGKYNEDSTKGGSYARIKAKRIRGVVSYGYMIPVNPMDIVDVIADAVESGNPKETLLYEHFNAKHYDPPNAKRWWWRSYRWRSRQSPVMLPR